MALDATEWKKNSKRPETATLDRPALLDPCWLKKLDMTTLTKENMIELENLILSKKLKEGETAGEDAKMRKVGRVLNATYRIRTRTAEKKESEAREDFGGGGSAFPSPCRACDRSAMRERFHTHPKNKKTKTTLEEPKAVKSSVTKPVAIKFRSGGKTEEPAPPEGSRITASKSANSPAKSPAGALRKADCPKRPEKEPARSPASQIVCRSYSKPFPGDEIDAHRCDQVILVKCSGCSRSFHPNRVSVHERACLANKRNVPKMEDKLSTLAYCYVCGKVFEKNSLLLPNHIEECLAKWHEENQALPESLRKPEPIKPEMVLEDLAGSDDSFWQQHLTKLIPCFKCGRKFNPDRVKIHEKSCKGLINK